MPGPCLAIASPAFAVVSHTVVAILVYSIVAAVIGWQHASLSMPQRRQATAIGFFEETRASR